MSSPTSFDLREWDPETTWRPIRSIEARAKGYRSIDVSPDGRHLLVVPYDEPLARLIDVPR